MGERTHIAETDALIVLHDADWGSGRGVQKPAGFWYEVDGDWRRWCQDQRFLSGIQHLHAVDLGHANVLQIATLAGLDAFHAEYSTADPLGHLDSIDWPRVAERYDGVEIAPYQWERRLAPDLLWYYGWDCASGVIWRPRDATVAYLGPVEIGEPVEAE